MAVRLIDAAAATAMPWANGQGITRELVRHESSERRLLCRLSIADVIAPSRFSKLPGIDRHLILIEGLGFELHIAARIVPVIPFVPVSFSGDESVSAARVASPSRDFNVMVDRQVARADVSVQRGGFEHSTPYLGYYYVVEGTFSTQSAEQRLESGALVEVFREPFPTFRISGSGVLIRVAISLADAGKPVT